MAVSPVIGKDQTIQHLLDIFLRLLKDESATVILNAISKLDNLNETIGIQALSQSIFPAIMELSKDPQWRMRLSIIEYIPLLAKKLKEAFFEKNLMELSFDWLDDDVHWIREAATNNLHKICKEFGSKWFEQNMLPHIIQLRSKNCYMRRMTFLQGVKKLRDNLSFEALRNLIEEHVLKMCGDKVANVRFAVCKTLAHVSKRLPGTYTNANILPTLITLSRDNDNDVKFFANEALDVIKSR